MVNNQHLPFSYKAIITSQLYFLLPNNKITNPATSNMIPISLNIKSYQHMFRGTFSAPLFYNIGAVCAVLSLVVIYWQSQYYHHEAPFPKRTISQVAQHYPEFVVFRLSTITGSSLILLGWLTNHFFLQTFALEQSIDLAKYHPRVPLTMGCTAGMLLMGSTALIDTGHMNELFHGICATSFFILTFAAQIYNSIICILLQQKTGALNNRNMYLKYFILAMLAFQLVDSSINGGDVAALWMDRLTGGSAVGSDKSNFFEWTLTVTVISMFISMGLDAAQFQFVYTENEKATQQSEITQNQLETRNQMQI